MSVTARLADSLPASAMTDWRQKQRVWLRGSGIDIDDPRWREAFAELPGEFRRRFHEEFTEGFQKMLDAGHGCCLLAEPEVAGVVEEALTHFDGLRYAIGDRVLAGNHFHALMTPLNGFRVRAEVTAIKRITAKRIHEIRGTFRAGVAAGKLRPPRAEPGAVAEDPGVHRVALTPPGAQHAGAEHAGGSPSPTG